MNQEQTEKLIDFVKYYATCPCCEKADVCVPGCEFEEVDAQAHYVMMMARDALRQIA